jgi:hypothetical protein
LSGF